MIKKNKIQSVSQMYFNNQELAIWVMYEADYFDQGCIIWIWQTATNVLKYGIP